jgi:hypothetical protein
MSITAKLKVILKVDDAIVAESEDAKLWQAVFDSIRKESLHEAIPADDNSIDGLLRSQGIGKDAQGSNDAIQSFAQKLGVAREIVQGACSPSLEAPYIHLDKHHWEALKKVTPAHGKNAIAQIVISATILAVWKEHIKAPQTTRKEAEIALKSIGLEDKAIPRGLGNCEWLQVRGDNIQIHPAHTSKAIALVRAYCQKDTPEFVKKIK